MENDTTNILSILALAIACLSMIVGATSLGWNIYKDVVKPKWIISFGVKAIVGGGSSETIISLSGTNSRQGAVTANITVLQKTGFFRKLFRCSKYWIVNPDHKHLYCSKLPIKLNMSDEVRLIFPYNKECFLCKKPNRVGISDNYGKTHWASRQSIKAAIKQYKKDFPKK